MHIPIILLFCGFVSYLHAMDVAKEFAGLEQDVPSAMLQRRDISDSLQTPLHRAAAMGKTETVSELLRADADRFAEDLYGNTPLHEACARGHRDCIALLAVGASLAHKNFCHETVLHRICESKSLEGLTVLLEAGRDRLAAFNMFDRSYRTPLHRACEVGWLDGAKLMIVYGAEISFRSITSSQVVERVSPDKTALAYVCSLDGFVFTEEHLKIAKYFIEQGADLEASTLDGMTPLLFAALNNHDALVRHLVEKGALINAASKSGFTAVHGAVLADSASLLEFLIRNKADVNPMVASVSGSPLNLACMRNSYACAKVLLTQGQALVSTQDSAGNSAIHHAVMGGNLKLVAFLRKHGADINAPGVVGRTPLQMACARGFKDVAGYLISQGAQMNTLDAAGRSTARIALEQRQWHLLEEGENTQMGMEQLHHALGKENGLSTIAH